MRLDYANVDKTPLEKRAEGLLMECPICGGKAEIWYHPTAYDPDRPFVRCSKCGLSSSATDYSVSHSWNLAFAKLIVRWNTREYLPAEVLLSWNELGDKFDEMWKIPFYSDGFFAELFDEMEKLREEW